MMARRGSLDEVMADLRPTLWTPGSCSSREAHVIGKGGYIDTANQRFSIDTSRRSSRRRARAGRHHDFQRPARATRGHRERRTDHQPLFGDAIVSPDWALLVVEKFPWASTLDVTWC
jgi:hypothetical protein